MEPYILRKNKLEFLIIVSCQSRHISLFLNKGEYILIFSTPYFKITITTFKVIKTKNTFRENKYLKK
ncbi:hypothetical protein FC755_01900 [Clostridium sporogenes]|nr:hypothetical protein C7M79_14040 [Clostridium botulinum]NFE44297.1 hypothetical protein [Clostridium sporogenes]NFS56557.1 hypothetical protein [Clostridium sporogenes]NFT26555.1 hypothetical protein [Clostridium sporogenes]